jgi:Family of unknown function (DUF6228)
VTVVELGSEPVLTLTAEPPFGTPEYVFAELRAGSLVASSRIMPNYASGFGDLADFIAGLADSWRGWDGVRVWRSVESSLHIAATHDGHVQLVIELRDDPNSTWSASASITIEPGEELSRAAAGLRHLADGS